MYFSKKKYRVRAILLSLADADNTFSREIPIYPQEKSALKAGEVLEEVLKAEMGSHYFKIFGQILRRTKGAPITAEDLQFVFSECTWDNASESETEGIDFF